MTYIDTIHTGDCIDYLRNLPEASVDCCVSSPPYYEYKPFRNKRSVWNISTKPFKEAHFATFPEDLIVPCILAGSREGGVVLDPFMGAGTTAVVARKLNRHFAGCDLSPEYVGIAERCL